MIQDDHYFDVDKYRPPVATIKEFKLTKLMLAIMRKFNNCFLKA